MSRGDPSGYSLTKADIPIVLGMAARGDRNHDIAAWFGVNQGRIAEAKDGKFGSPAAAPAHALPPKGAPGIKGRRLRSQVEIALGILSGGDLQAGIDALKKAVEDYDANEA